MSAASRGCARCSVHIAWAGRAACGKAASDAGESTAFGSGTGEPGPEGGSHARVAGVQVRRRHRRARVWILLLVACGLRFAAAEPHAGPQPAGEQARDPAASPRLQRLLYVAVPGIRNYLEYGGHGLLVFDIDKGHAFVKRIATAGRDAAGQPLNVKGVCAHAGTGRIYISTLRYITCLDLVTEKILWEREYEGGCDRLALTPDGRTLFVPSLEGPHWNVVDAESGEVRSRIVTDSGAHNTIASLDGRYAYLAGLRSPYLTVVDARSFDVVGRVGPFSASIRPFTVDAAGRYCYVNVNDLLGFEVGDLQTGRKVARVEVAGFQRGPTKRHGCPSHGIGLTPDGQQLWLTDAANSRLHVFDATVMPPRQTASIELRDQPGWVTFSLDGAYAYPSTGDVIDTATRRIVAQLTDETGAAVQSEKLLEIDFQAGRPILHGDQFGLGRARNPVP